MSQQPQWQPTHPPAPPVRQKGWFARNTVLSIILGIVLLVVLCCCGAGVLAVSGDTDESTNQEPATKSTPGVGSPVRDGKFEFTVTKVEAGVSEVGSEYLRETADGQFVLVHITVENIGDEAQTLFDSEQKLVDAEGRSFATDSTASIYMDDNDVWINEINPGNTVRGTLVYDMPAGAQPAEIELHDSLFSGGVTVSVK